MMPDSEFMSNEEIVDQIETTYPGAHVVLIKDGDDVVFRDYAYYKWAGADLRRESVFVDGMD